MRAAEARRIVHELGLEERIAKDAVDTPPLTNEQRVALRSILLAPDMTEPAPRLGAGPAVTLTDHRGSRRDESGPL
jgi:hypothetical protein